MPAGMEFYYPTGATKISYTDYFGMFFSQFTTNGATSGTWQDNRLIGKELLHHVSSTAGNYGGPNVSLNSATGVISWSFNISTTGGANPGAAPNTTVYYGGF